MRAKTERWLSDRAKAEKRAEERRLAKATDSIELWVHIVSDLMSLPSVQHAGLLLHSYRGAIDEEVIKPLRLTVPLQKFENSLRQLREDQILIAV